MAPEQSCKSKGKSKFEILMGTIIEKSKSKEWDIARNEWKVVAIEFADFDHITGQSVYETCTCGHYPIKEIIVIKNNNTKTVLRVGNCCVRKIIIGEDDIKRHQAIFNSMKTHSLNMELIRQAYATDHYITEWEFDFLKKLFRKRSCTQKQADLYMKLGNMVVRLYESKYKTASAAVKEVLV